MQLLVVPAVLGSAAILFNERSSQIQNEIAVDNQREVALQTYIDKMSELLLDKHLRAAQPGTEIRDVARTRTLSVLRRLDGERKGLLLQFLHESQLISTTNPIIDFATADLRKVHLRSVDLTGGQPEAC